MTAWLDRLSTWLARLAAWLFLATGAMLTYEVVARYLFNAPTVWAEELSRLLLVWGTYLAAAALVRRREHIRITLVTDRLEAGPRRWLEGVSLAVVAAGCAVAVWYGTPIAVDSFLRGRSTGTMLDIPNWWSEAAIPVGCGLVVLQCLAEIARLLGGAPAGGEARSDMAGPT